MNEADEVFRDRMVPACVKGLSDELGLPAEACDILLVVDDVTGGRVLPTVEVVEQEGETGQRRDDIALGRRLFDFDRGLAIAQAVDKRRWGNRDNGPTRKPCLIGSSA